MRFENIWLPLLRTDPKSLFDFVTVYELSVFQCEGQFFYFFRDSIRRMFVDSSVFLRCTMRECVIDLLEFGGICDTIDFKGSKFLKAPKIIPNRGTWLVFDNCNFNEMQGEIDLTGIHKFGETMNVISLKHTDLSKIKFNYSDFMVENADAFDVDFIKLDYEHRGDFYRMWSWIARNWRNYGHGRALIFRNSIALFLLFLLGNFLFGLKKLTLAYNPSSFEDVLDIVNSHSNHIIKKIWLIFCYTFAYTMLVFWGISLERKEVKAKHLVYFIYLMTQYIFGLICLAYLASYILSKS
jgi:hypothetical protein